MGTVHPDITKATADAQTFADGDDIRKIFTNYAELITVSSPGTISTEITLQDWPGMVEKHNYYGPGISINLAKIH